MPIKKVNVAHVLLRGEEIGAVAWNEEKGYAEFEYTDSFLRTGQELAPLMMPRTKGIFSFPGLPRHTFHGLPGLLADALPDRFGNTLIDLWLARQGRDVADFSPVERLCYVGSRGTGALEFKPALVRARDKTTRIDIAELVELARDILAERKMLRVRLDDREEALNTIIRVGTSAGGARAKAVVAWNPATSEVRSGQVDVPKGFEPWIIKFDGVDADRLGEPKGYGRVEFAYHLMAREAGIDMTPCRLLEENGRAHFMTRRFDRTDDNAKKHLASLCGIAHFDFNAPGAYGYEQAFSVVQRLGLGHNALRELFRRMVFNVVSRNQDDHTRNISFLMSDEGEWNLAPAYDVTWAFNPAGDWTATHQMTINGKRDGFVRSDIMSVSAAFGIRGAVQIIDSVIDAVSRWGEFATEAGVFAETRKIIGASHRFRMDEAESS